MSELRDYGDAWKYSMQQASNEVWRLIKAGQLEEAEQRQATLAEAIARRNKQYKAWVALQKSVEEELHAQIEARLVTLAFSLNPSGTVLASPPEPPMKKPLPPVLDHSGERLIILTD